MSLAMDVVEGGMEVSISTEADLGPASRGKRKCTQAVQSPAEKQRRRRSTVKSTTDEAVDDNIKDDNDWICSACYQSEAFDGSDLVLCDGPCLRSYHIGCLDQGPNLVRWKICSDCG